MDIGSKTIKIAFQDAIFIFKDCGVDGFFEIQELRSEGGTAALIKFCKDNLVGIENVTQDGKEISLEEFKQANLPTDLAFSILKEYTDYLAKLISDLSTSKEEAVETEKNVG
jgi:hypothetical protein